MLALGLDIGGTKCAAVIGSYEKGECRVLAKEKIPTASFSSPDALLSVVFEKAEQLLSWTLSA